MTFVITTCPRCGTVDLATADVTVRVCTTTGQVTYAFRCPTCGRIAVKDADNRRQGLLLAAGVPFVSWALPEREAMEGPALGWDDLLDLRIELGGMGFLEGLRA